MIETKFDTLYVCEIKFSKHPIGVDVIHEVAEKINRLQRPQGFSCRPVLIHASDVTAQVKESDYFSCIINMSQFLEGH